MACCDGAADPHLAWRNPMTDVLASAETGESLLPSKCIHIVHVSEHHNYTMLFLICFQGREVDESTFGSMPQTCAMSSCMWRADGGMSDLR